MIDIIEAATPYLMFTAALAAAATALATLWRRVVGPALDNTLLRGIHDRIEIVDARVGGIEGRLSQEFADGYPPNDERYVPMRKYLEGHIGQSHAWQDAHDRQHEIGASN